MVSGQTKASLRRAVGATEQACPPLCTGPQDGPRGGKARAKKTATPPKPPEACARSTWLGPREMADEYQWGEHFWVESRSWDLGSQPRGKQKRQPYPERTTEKVQMLKPTQQNLAVSVLPLQDEPRRDSSNQPGAAPPSS